VVSIESAAAVTTEVNASYTSGSAFVITGTNSATDVVDYICVGY
jgi:hypothetical protein